MRAETWLGLGLLALIIAGGIAVAPRGIRNNNPLNLREPPSGGDQWVGERATDDDPAFEEFEHPKWGIRAAARVLASYQRRGVVTLRGIIETWAPRTENATGAYLAHVASRLRLDPDAPIGTDRWPELLAAMTLHENGVQPYPRALFHEGVRLALENAA